MSTETPRTDAETYVWQDGGENPFVHRDFARQLERELAASKGDAESYKKLGIELVKELISKCDDPIHKAQLKELER